jgi:hypothetical protein
MIMEESYSINMSAFLGKAEKMMNVEEEEANYKFLEMLGK